MENEEYEFSREDYKQMFEKAIQQLANADALKDFYREKMNFKSEAVIRLERRVEELRMEIEALRNKEGE